MRKIFVLFFILIIFFMLPVKSEENYTLSAGVSINEIPKTFYGSWRVVAKLDETDSLRTFKPQSVDIWTLSRVGNVITLSNPFNGASAQISLKTVEGNLVIFSKEAPFGDKILTDTVSLRLDKNKFSGINTLYLKTYSTKDGEVKKTESARYIINGEKISGEDVL
jgi:hypothetical protein